MPQFIAQCPECSTSFRIRPDQLEAAGGLVRCGACLNVFPAAEHRIHLKGDAPAPEPELPPPFSPLADPPLVEDAQNLAAGADFVDDEALGAIGREELAAIEDTPIEMEAAPPPRRRRFLLLLAANLALALLLAGQILWTRFDTLLANPRYRPALELLCRHAGCAIATFRDLGAIQAEELSVRSHPARADALQVDIIFRNNATLPQDFPLLELSFFDLRDRLVANRRFSPDEYLPADLRQLSEMPPRVPVQLTLELLDPGPEAVNYTLAFRLR